ncbi:MAG: hypothetical protein EOM69_12235, partial [Clostridia bacterium]|nr:hypothetical protein [Clostridia bacterium]
MKRDKRQKKRLRLSYALSSFALAATLFMVTQQLSSAGDSAKAATPSSGRRHTSAAYVYDRPTLTLRDEDAKSLDQLNYSFALIKNGRVTGDHWSSIATFKNYIRKYPHILPVLSIGGP